MARKLISLGTRCDVAFQLRMHSGDNTAHVFDWLATTAEGLTDIIRRDFQVFAPDDLAYVGKGKEDPGFVIDVPTATEFHHQFPRHGEAVTRQFLVNYPAFRAKFDYLAARFRDTVRHHSVTLVRRYITQGEAEALEASVFKVFPGADVQFLYLNGKGPAFETAAGRCVILAPSDLSLGDPIAWSDMLMTAGLVTTPYRLSAIDIFGGETGTHTLGPDNRFTVEHLRDALRHNPGRANFHFELARALRPSDASAAEAAMGEALRLDPGNVTFEAERLSLLRQREVLSARDHVAALTKLAKRTDDGRLDFALGDALREAGNARAAVAAYDRHLLRAPLDTQAYFSKALCLRALKKNTAAEKTLRVYLSLMPNWAHAHSTLSEILFDLGRTPKAVAAARRAAELSPVPQYRFALAEMLDLTGEYAEARPMFVQLALDGEIFASHAQHRLDHPRGKVTESV